MGIIISVLFILYVLKIPKLANFDFHNLAKRAALCNFCGSVVIADLPCNVVEKGPQKGSDGGVCICSS